MSHHHGEDVVMDIPSLLDFQPSPLMTIVNWILVSEAVLLLLFTLPLHVPYRRTAVDFLVHSARTERLRLVFGTLFAVVAFAIVDTLLRFNRLHDWEPSDVRAVRNFTAGRAARLLDLQIMLFALFLSVILFCQLHILLRMGRYRLQRNTLREQLLKEGLAPADTHIHNSHYVAGSPTSPAMQTTQPSLSPVDTTAGSESKKSK